METLRVIYDLGEYMMIFILTLLLFGMVIANYRICEREIFNPAFVTTGSFFLFSSLCCLANMYIGIDINSIMTILVIVTGLGLFSFVNYCQLNSKHKCEFYQKYDFKVDDIWVYIGLFTMLAMIYVNYKYIIDFAGAYGIGGDFFECMLQYKTIMTFSDASEILVPSPWYRQILMILATVFAYMFLYLFFRDRAIYKKTRYFYLLIVTLYIIYSLMGGGRSSTFRLITAMLFLWGYFKEKTGGDSFSPSKMLLKVLSIIGMVAVLFVLFVVAVGRTTYDFDLEYVITSVFVYAAAPIFNLDIYFENPWKQTYGIWGEMTFIRGINWLGSHLDISSWVYALDLPFLSYQGYNLGNVFTTFYPFYYDFGFIGVCVLSLFMAIFSLWCYRHMRGYNADEAVTILWIVAYAYLINDLIMLPFSNRFYETIVNVGTWYNLIAFYCLVRFLRKLRVLFDN